MTSKSFDSAPLIPVQTYRLDTEGRSVNPADGAPVNIMLFQKAGRLSEMEYVVYVDPMPEIPPIETIEVFFVDRAAQFKQLKGQYDSFMP